MDYVEIICVIVLIGCIIFTILHNKKIDRDNDVQLHLYKKDLENRITKEAKAKINEIQDNAEKAYNEKYNLLLNERKRALEKFLDDVRVNGLTNIQNEIDEWAKSAQEAALYNFK